MGSEGKSASDRLDEYFAAAEVIATTLETTIAAVGDQFGDKMSVADWNWTDPENPFLMPLINRAFAAASLDPHVPWHWRVLLYCFASAHYTIHKRKKWNSHAYCELLQAADYVKYKNPRLSKDSQICAQLAKMPRYRKVKSDHLRKMLRQARDPKLNHLLDLIAESAGEPIREYGRAHALANGEQIALALKPLHVGEVLKSIATAWRKGPPK